MIVRAKLRFSIFFLLYLILFCLYSVPPGRAHHEEEHTRPEMLRGVAFEQRLNEQIPLGLTFRDESGRSVQLGKYFGRKPIVLTLVYYDCPNLCSLALSGLLKSLRVLSFDVGSEFQVVAVSIDPKEGPSVALMKKREILKRYARPRLTDGWHFLTGDEDSIKHLARSIGFRYRYDAEKKQYAHAAGLLLLTPEGRVSRYFYGIEYPPRDLRLGLIEASANRIGSAVDKLLLFCYRYDPSSGKYGLIIMNAIRLAGLSTVLVLGSFILVMFRRDRDGSPWSQGST